MDRKTLTFAAAIALFAVAACSEQNTDDAQKVPEVGANEAGLIVGSVVDENSDVAGVRYIISPCGKPDEGITIDRPLEDQMLPGNIYDFQNSPLDEDSSHLFSDLFEVLDPGCYDVFAQPIDEFGNSSEICAAAWKNGVMVYEGQTTEVFLILQCAGSDPGAIDIIAAINHEPSLEEVYFVDSKFVCGSTTRICLNGSDVDNDPLEFELDAPEGCEVEQVPAGQIEDDACFDLTCHDWGKFDLTARVYDLVWKDGSLIRIEDWLAQEGYPNESHGELNFFAYFDGVKYYPDEDKDGFGDGTAVLICEGDEPPDGYVRDDTDCDDQDAQTYPGAEEICGDEKDNDCDGEVDEGCVGCQGNTCGNFQNGECSCGETGFGLCWTSPEPGVGGICGRDFYCTGLAGCDLDNDCDVGEHCLVGTCCGGCDGKAGVCAPAATFEPQCEEFPSNRSLVTRQSATASGSR